jgi:hypothetical protein
VQLHSFGTEVHVSKHFRLGELSCTPEAERVLAASGQLATDFLLRHMQCDWGNVSEQDWSVNKEGLETGGRLKSVYKTLNGETIWIVTEADRSKTTVLLPSEP